MSHYAVRPDAICNAIINDLNALDSSYGIKTIKRYAGELSEESIDLFLTKGVPAYLVQYRGGPFSSGGTGRGHTRKRIWSQTRNFQIICIAGSWLSIEHRFTDADSGVISLEGMLDYGTYAGYRALLNKSAPLDFNSPMQNPMILNHSEIAYMPTRYVMAINLSCMVHMDFWDDDPDEVLETIGLCKDPTDYDDLFEVDNVTPKSDTDPPMSGGVTDL